MNTRDEMARRDEEDWVFDYEAEPGIARNAFRRGQDALIAEGWRKMPSREEVARTLDPLAWKELGAERRMASALARADAILALMDGGSA